MSPLYVDLDGTFIKSDMLFESCVAAVKARPWVLLLCFFWLIKGRAYVKYRLSHLVDIEPALLPLNPELYTFLEQQWQQGRCIILATASAEKYAQTICQHFSLFQSYISSTASINLKGSQKLAKIQSLSPEFAYAGDSAADFAVFAQAQQAYLVNPSWRATRLALSAPPNRVFDTPARGVMLWLRQLRVHQWLKNTLIFVPLLVSGEFLYTGSVLLSVLGFFAFSCVASANYIANDLIDLEADRSHPRKQRRPLAAGDIGIGRGVLGAFLLLVSGFVIGIYLGAWFSALLAVYLVVTSLYSLILKRHTGVDVITLSVLYCVRIFAGAALLDVGVSFWLFSFSILVFFSLALVKRCAELKDLLETDSTHAKGRAYTVNDYPVLMGFGTASAMLSVLMFSFYVNSNVLLNQYQQPTMLWLILPVYGYWIMRMWLKTHQGEMHDDPIVFSLSDRGSLAALAIIGVTTIVAQLL